MASRSGACRICDPDDVARFAEVKNDSAIDLVLCLLFVELSQFLPTRSCWISCSTLRDRSFSPKTGDAGSATARIDTT